MTTSLVSPSPQYWTNCELRVIDLGNGAVEYLFIDFTDAAHNDLTGVPVSIALGSYQTPGTWHPADVVQQNGAVWKIRAGLLIGGVLTYPAGLYYAWIKLVDSPETIVSRSDNRLVEITGSGDSGLYGAGVYGSGLYGG